MGRRFTGGGLVLLVAVGIAACPAHAKDRKSSSRDREALSEMIATSPARAAASSAPTEMSSGGRNGKPIAPLAEQQVVRSNPFRFNIGAVAVQPTVGGIKGAQFSIGF